MKQIMRQSRDNTHMKKKLKMDIVHSGTTRFVILALSASFCIKIRPIVTMELPAPGSTADSIMNRITSLF